MKRVQFRLRKEGQVARLANKRMQILGLSNIPAYCLFTFTRFILPSTQQFFTVHIYIFSPSISIMAKSKTRQRNHTYRRQIYLTCKPLFTGEHSANSTIRKRAPVEKIVDENEGFLRRLLDQFGRERIVQTLVSLLGKRAFESDHFAEAEFPEIIDRESRNEMDDSIILLSSDDETNKTPTITQAPAQVKSEGMQYSLFIEKDSLLIVISITLPSFLPKKPPTPARITQAETTGISRTFEQQEKSN